ncbi:putative bifunctional diguanylate cyclase/phosphodiesterase [Micromonospora inyonensis]|uniref:Diguanylate cyclase (GGDEF) domain-containing protein n=1 Tax=Micromonospora inyonensis TaxID=47866 RepID=A0A1C6RSE5_9ACTN|nr:GGDEF domain-containing protein [Micromonospora inyonensis]SCL20078.1 diguanylate cyclase (GGDEF) domain-containing protein [Micromonospora inyonensis]
MSLAPPPRVPVPVPEPAVVAVVLLFVVAGPATPACRAAVATGGLCAVALLHAVGPLPVPGRAPRPAGVRLRAATEAVGLGLGLAFASWMLLPAGAAPVPVRAALVVAAVGISAVLVTAPTDGPSPVGAVVWRAGAVTGQLGLAGLVLLHAYRAPQEATLPVALLTAAGALLTASGARRLARAAPPQRTAPGGLWPRITAPAVIAALAAGYHLVRVGEFDRTEVVLGLAVIPPMVVRELLTVADTRRLGGREARGADEGLQREARDADEGRQREARDADERRRPEPVPDLAGTDHLTGLADRRELRRALTGRRAGTGEPATLLVLDLHGLCAVDDGSGPTAGDRVRVEAARRLRATAGPDDLVARLAGDQFAVVVGSGSVPAYGLALRLLDALTAPYRLPGAYVRLEVSIGLADTAAGSADDVLRQADLARRRASQLGRDRIEWYDVFLEEQLVRRLDLERELAGAVARGELDLVYQPVHGLADRVPVGTEALLRWRSPLLGTVLPAELIPVAVDLGLLGEVGQWVLDRACRQLAAWSAVHPSLWMAVNVTPEELTAADVVTRVADTLARYGVPAERLVVEVGEAGLDVDLPTVVARLAGLRSLGVRTALDDFHAGRASLRRLRELPIDLVKVDPRAVGGGEGEQPLVDVVANLARRLGLEVVVEELESTGQVDRAYQAGCRYGQGFALSRPATAERVEALLEEHPSPGAFA